MVDYQIRCDMGKGKLRKVLFTRTLEQIMMEFVKLRRPNWNKALVALTNCTGYVILYRQTTLTIGKKFPSSTGSYLEDLKVAFSPDRVTSGTSVQIQGSSYFVHR